jgi:hypothetical protein
MFDYVVGKGLFDAYTLNTKQVRLFCGTPDKVLCVKTPMPSI